jgi:hypothetical protein
MILEILIGLFVLAMLAIAAYLIWKFTRKPISFIKKMEEGTTKIEITANRDLDKLSIVRIEKSKEKTEFSRAEVKRGETVEFHFEDPNAKEKILIEFDGEKQEYKVE